MKSELSLKKVLKYVHQNKKLLLIIMLVSIITSTALNLLLVKTNYNMNLSIQLTPVTEANQFQTRFNLVNRKVLNKNKSLNKIIKDLELDQKLYSPEKLMQVITIQSDATENNVEINVNGSNKQTAKDIAIQVAQEFATEWINEYTKTTKLIYEEGLKADKDALDIANMKLELNGKALKETSVTIELANVIKMDGQVADGEEINPVYVQLMNKSNELQEEARLIELKLEKEKKKYEELLTSIENQKTTVMPKMLNNEDVEIELDKEFIELGSIQDGNQTSMLSRIGVIVLVNIACLMFALLIIIFKEYLKNENEQKW
ncbi:hypothetical protein [Cohnella mopanensis]|uniref:hypothetical protein n=1 Tax=Cohnella mopanensis TaxID=2911966 RepID=UPI001EF9A5C1|nr:hypothetical protein [Cohnella mopanensis]